jgi:hypothetical protein
MLSKTLRGLLRFLQVFAASDPAIERLLHQESLQPLQRVVQWAALAHKLKELLRIALH